MTEQTSPILVIEHDPVFRKKVLDVLVAAGFVNVYEASTLTQANEMIAEGIFFRVTDCTIVESQNYLMDLDQHH